MTTGPARPRAELACKCTDRENAKNECGRRSGSGSRAAPYAWIDHGRVGAEPVGAARRCAPRDRNPRDRCPGLDRVRQPGALPPRRRRCGNAHDECSHHVDLGLQRAAHDQFGTDDRCARLPAPRRSPERSGRASLVGRGGALRARLGLHERHDRDSERPGEQALDRANGVTRPRRLRRRSAAAPHRDAIRTAQHAPSASPPSTPNPHATTKRPNGRFRSRAINAPRQHNSTSTSTSTNHVVRLVQRTDVQEQEGRAD